LKVTRLRLFLCGSAFEIRRRAFSASQFRLRHHVIAVAVVISQSNSIASAQTKTIDERVAEFGASVDARLAPFFHGEKIAYPPQQLVLIGLKNEKQMELWAGGENGKLKFIRSYPILAASGTSGPKLREGDGQVPEGFYKIESLNPNSRFHLALRVGYPNDFDRARAKEDHRKKLGGDIMIHGNHVTIGCLAMGDEAAEDLFVLAAKAGIANIRVILSPVDFRTGADVELQAELPRWTRELYGRIKSELEKFRRE
jgi:hypothetical protein